jgi:hypothetical protein
MEAAIGKARIVCPITTADGVNRREYLPRGPVRVKKENTRSPITTVGRAIRLLRTDTIKRFPRNFFTAMPMPRTIAGIDARKVEMRENLIEVKAIK